MMSEQFNGAAVFNRIKRVTTEFPMGCDIHCHVEVKINGRWEHWSAPHIGRDYTLFTRMAGVRGRDVPTIAMPRGMPADPSIITEIDYFTWGSAAHSHSWLSGAEIEGLITEYEVRASERVKEAKTDRERERAHHNPWYLDRGGFGYLFGNGFDVQRDPREYPDGIEDCRLVFWFDN